MEQRASASNSSTTDTINEASNEPSPTLSAVSRALSSVGSLETTKRKRPTSVQNEASKECPTPYHVVCRQRIKSMKKVQDEQFKTEIKNLEAMQQSAYDQIRFHRFFAVTTLWPPLHNRDEIERTMRCFYGRTQSDSRRLNFILENTIP